MSKTILHPTDFSECAENSLQYALFMAKKMSCKIKLLHALDYSEVSVTSRNAQSMLKNSKELEEEAKNRLLEIGTRIQNEGVVCEITIHSGRIGNWLPEYSEEAGAEYIVMGTTGAGSFKNKLLGSNAFEIIKKTKTPVLCVPKDARKENLSNFLYLQDAKTKDIDQLLSLAKLAEHADAQIKVVHFSIENASEGKQQLERLQKELELKSNFPFNYSIQSVKDVTEGIKEEVSKNKPDLIALVMRNQNFFQRLFKGSLTETLVNQSEIPLLVFAD